MESGSGQRATLGVLRETAEYESRVALIPEQVKRYVAAGHRVVVETNAGMASSYRDDAYTAVGGTIVGSAGDVYQQADVVLRVAKPTLEDVDLMRTGTLLVGLLSPLLNHDLVERLQRRGVTSVSMDAVPRITRAQSMDALSSQATVAGYKAVLMAADLSPKFFPLLMTAAGTIPPAKVVILGAGVAGLQAIATARRLGAKVKAYDFRPEVKEQVNSLGAEFIEIELSETGTGSGGYAKEASTDTLSRQQAGLAGPIGDADAVITTAAVPGRPAPRLIPASTVERMRPGSVIVDLGAEMGGNCELTRAREVYATPNGVTIVGMPNLPSQMPFHASQMYSKNIQNLLALFIDKQGAVNLDFNDEIVAGSVITHGGEIRHAGTRKAMGLADQPAAS
jgi:NAD(P) transhydrogenase subunit alpha